MSYIGDPRYTDTGLEVPQWHTPPESNMTYPQDASFEIIWTNTIAHAPFPSYYHLKFDDNASMSSPTYVKLHLKRTDPPNHYKPDGGWGAGTHYVQVRAVYCNYDDNGEPESQESEWSEQLTFTIDPEYSEDPDDNAHPLKENRMKFLPIIYGKFNRDDADPRTSNGLAVAYLSKFIYSKMEYAYADHQVNTEVDKHLYIPSPGASKVLMYVESPKDALNDSINGASFYWMSEQGVHKAQKKYNLSDKRIGAPFLELDDDGNQKWRATNYEGIILADGSSATVRLHADEQIPWHASGFKWNSFGGAAWEISDPENSLSALFKGAEEIEFYLYYKNLHKLYTFTLPDDPKHPEKVGADEDVSDEVSFQLCNYVNKVTETLTTPIQTISYDRTLVFDVNEWESAGPLRKTSLELDTNRNLAVVLQHATMTDNDNRLSSDTLTLDAAFVVLWQIFYADEIMKSLKGYVACDGRMYGSRLSNYDIANTFGAILYNQYTNASRKLTIEDPAMVIESLLVDYGDVSTSNIDTTSFANAISIGQTIVVNITKDNKTIKDAVKDICRQTPFSFVYTPSGQARIINIRTVTINAIDDAVATIPWYDIDPSKFKPKKTPLDKVVNVLAIKSRWHAETNSWLDYDEFENSTSITKYGRKKSKSILEFKNINSGPNARDENNNPTGPAFYNSVKWQAIHLIEPDKENGETDTGHAADDGWLSKQHNDLNIYLPGYKYMALEIGDVILIDNDSFVAHGTLCHGETWTDKRFRIQAIKKDQDGVTITSAVQMPEYEDFFTLRGVDAFV